MSDKHGRHDIAELFGKRYRPRQDLRNVEGRPDVLVYKEGECYKVTVFSRSGRTRKLKPQTYLLVEENGNLFVNTGYRVDVSYNEAADVLTFSPGGDYVRKEERA